MQIGRFPQGLARFVISRFEGLSGLSPSQVYDLRIERLILERLDDYRHTQGPFPCITLGSALGGASAHLSLALGGPFLPQAFVLSLRGGSKDGSIATYYHRSADLAKHIATQNPGVLTIQHYDPVHDEWMTRRVNHLRFKLLELPKAYQDYIRGNLQEGGSVCYLDCRARWLRYRVGEQSFFQVGGWGDISAQEYIDGSPRLERYAQNIGLQDWIWRLVDFPLEEGPESEWGAEAGLGEALEKFCMHNGYQYTPISLPEPHDFSRLAFRALEYLLQKEGREPVGTLIEMFSQFDPTAVIRSGMLPLWLVFNTQDSLDFLKTMRPELPSDKPIFFSPLATFTLTPDIVAFPEWGKALQGLNWQNIGARPSHYPADALALINWSAPLRAWVNQNTAPIQELLTPGELQRLVQENFSN